MSAEVLIVPRQPRRLLVTGGAGFIGSAFIRMLFSDPGFAGSVVNLDLLTYAGNLKNLEARVDLARYNFVQGDVQDRLLLDSLLVDIDTVVHFAAESHVDRSIDGPKDFIRTNILGSFTLLEAIRSRQAGRQQIHLHHVSTDEVFGSLGSSGYFTEQTPYDPRSPYSASKAASDHLVRAYHHTYGLSCTISNCSNNYGPCQYPEKLIPLMIQNCVAGQPLPVYGDGQNVRDWLHVDDHVAAIWQVLTRAASGTTWNIGGRNELTNLQLLDRLIEAVATQTGKAPEEFRQLIRFMQDRSGHDRRYAIDCSKIEQLLGWQPAVDFKAGLEQAVGWYLGQGC